jgi:predicted phosphoribosyltransferase/predicted alpha/beta-hydrolase family hydrolase
MADGPPLFVDRGQAGRRLGDALQRLRPLEPLVIGLPRGGVPVAFEVARALGAPLDILLVRKLGAPFNPEYGVGAIAEGDVRFVRAEDAARVGMAPEDLEALIAREEDELRRRHRLYRGERQPLDVERRAVLLVDDGIATGGTAVAAARALRARGAETVILAVPIAPPGTEQRLGADFEEVVMLEQPHEFFGIGQFYVDFNQVSDEDVAMLLAAGAEQGVEIEAGPGVALRGDLVLPEPAAGLVVFAHGSGSGRRSPRNREVAASLNGAGLGTLLFDLLTAEEEGDRAKVFDIELLAGRLVAATRWVQSERRLEALPIGYFGASTGAAAALVAAARLGEEIGAVVSRGGRPDLAAESLGEVSSPTLLIVGGADREVLELNERAAGLMRCDREVAVVPGATHLFEEPGALERVSELAGEWFGRRLR